MALTTIIALLGFFIALVALWLASDILKKVESQNEKFVRMHITSLREEVKAMDALVRQAARSTKAQGDTQKDMGKRLTDQAKALDGLQARFSVVGAHLEALDRSIPQRYRVSVEKDENKSAEKPSIQ